MRLIASMRKIDNKELNIKSIVLCYHLEHNDNFHAPKNGKDISIQRSSSKSDVILKKEDDSCDSFSAWLKTQVFAVLSLMVILSIFFSLLIAILT